MPPSPVRSLLSPISILKAYDNAQVLAREQFLTLDDFAQGELLGREVMQMRLQRGERQVGYKIGFTNRSIWPLYGVSQPVWAPVYDGTVTLLPSTHVEVGLASFIQPRLEPEIVFGLRHSPANDSLSALTQALDWVAHGFEIVQSPYPLWKFTASEAQAAQGLHGALFVGPRTVITEALRTPELAKALSEAKLVLAKSSASASANANSYANTPGVPPQEPTDFKVVAQGQGAAVLDGPLQALGFLVRGLAERGQQLKADDIITTGTLTDAMPLVAGDAWRTEWVHDKTSIELSLSGLELICRP